MSMFDNVVFDEFTILEGQQAEEYKKRKAKEERAQTKKSMDRAARYTLSRIANSSQNEYGDNADKIAERIMKSSSRSAKEIEDMDDDCDNKKKVIKTGTKMMSAMDAIDRHERRHPKKECTFDTNYLFNNSDIKII